MNKRIPIIIGLILMGVALWLLLTPNQFQIIERLNHLVYDLQLRTHLLTNPKEFESPIVIIDIDDKSLKAEGQWPWSREKMGELTAELTEQGIAVVAFDMLFSEVEVNAAEKLLIQSKKNNILPPAFIDMLQNKKALFNQDNVLANSLSKTQSVLAIGFLPRKETSSILPRPILQMSDENKGLDIFTAEGYISNIPILQNAAKAGGFINIFADDDGIIRRAPFLIQYQNGLYPALSLQAVLSFLGETIQLVAPIYHDERKLEGIQIGNRLIPTDEKGQVLIPFVGNSYTFTYYSATDVLHHKLPKNALLGKIAFVGTSATGLGDLKPTAIENPFPGVEIQATLANGILTNSFSYVPAWTFGANLLLIIFFGSLASFVFPYLGPRTLSIVVICLPPILLFFNNWIWSKTGLILSFLMPVLLILIIAIFNIIYGYLFETRRREHLKEMFGQYVPAKHIDEMLHTKGGYALRGEDREMSVLFADIRNFTSISEDLSAKELVEMLNTIFTPVTEIIFKHRGTIDKYVGDLIMAFWGAPLRDKFHAKHAITAALDIQTKIKKLKPLLEENKWPEIKLGIGINSGLMSVGDMGSKYRRNYTVLGDAVNLASRIEGLTKFYGVDIIVSAHTQKNQNKFIFRKLDHVKVKGKKSGIDIYEVVCKIKDLTPEITEELMQYHQALVLYFEQKWDESYSMMQQLHLSHPDKKIYSLYLDRIQELRGQELPENWDGIYSHVNK